MKSPTDQAFPQPPRAAAPRFTSSDESVDGFDDVVIDLDSPARDRLPVPDFDFAPTLERERRRH